MSLRDAREQYEEQKRKRDRRIVELAVQNPTWTMQEIANKILGEFGECNKMTVSRALRKAGIKRN